MLKTLFTLFIVVAFVNTTNAQSTAPFTDTVIYYAKSRERVASADSAYYIRKILPFHSVSKLYPVVEYFKNSKLKLKAYAINNDGSQLHGSRLEYFENGKRKSISTFFQGQVINKEYTYYPNGKMYSLKEMTTQGWKLLECYDTTGNAVAKDGEGTWLDYDYDVEHFYISGPIKNGEKIGEWAVKVNDDITEVYDYSNAGSLLKTYFKDKMGRWLNGQMI